MICSINISISASAAQSKVVAEESQQICPAEKPDRNAPEDHQEARHDEAENKAGRYNEMDTEQVC